MHPLNDEMLNDLHHRLVKAKTAVDPFPAQPRALSPLGMKLRGSARFLGRLRRIRIQVTFEVAEPCPEIIHS